MRFLDRRDGGRRLGAALQAFRNEDPVVLALPRGGVPVGYEIARALDAPLDVLVVHKIGVPLSPGRAVGAIAEGGAIVLDAPACALLCMSDELIDEAVERERQDVGRRVRRYRGDRPLTALRGRTVILADDGIATGRTARAAIAAVRRARPCRIILAAPVASAETAEALRHEVDDLVCLQVSERFAVSHGYEEFRQVGDEEVCSLLARAAGARARASPEMGHAAFVSIPCGPCGPSVNVRLDGELAIPARARGVILFSDGSGSGRRNHGNRRVARALREAGFATLLVDLLTDQEEAEAAVSGRLRFNADLLGERLAAVTDWVCGDERTRDLGVGYFGANVGGAVALIAAAARPEVVHAIVSRGGRPDLAAGVLARVRAPTLLIAGGEDDVVVELNRRSVGALEVERQLVVLPGVTHLFEEPGARECVAELARGWFARFIAIAPGRGDRIDGGGAGAHP